MQPAIVFAGELFEKEEALGQAKGLLLDFFRGRQITNLAMKVHPLLGADKASRRS